MTSFIANHRSESLVDLDQFGIPLYPHTFHRTHRAAEVQEAYSHMSPADPPEGHVCLAGRLMGRRNHGRLSFVDLVDQSGKVQGALRPDRLAYDAQKVVEVLDLGDVVGLVGPVFRTRSGEITVQAEDVRLLAKCMQHVPDKWHGLQDIGVAREQRHVDLLVNSASRARFFARSHIIQMIRQFLWARGFTEAETSVLDTTYGGAEAHPFTTYCRDLERDVYLRISPELALKRLIIGGMERVFEIGKQFRNESRDARHHPEFTSLEVYQAFADYQDMMTLTEDLLSDVSCSLLGTTRVISRLSDGEVAIDLSPPFQRFTLYEAIRHFTGVDFDGVGDEAAHRLAQDLGVRIQGSNTADEVVLEVFAQQVEAHLVQPTFILDYPASLCPLTKGHRSDSRLAERFELFIGGMEFANAYTELNDPLVQQAHFEAQARKRADGDEQAHLPDWDFVDALAWGMPPTGGLGIGIDRLVLLLTGAGHIQDVILFPLRRSLAPSR